MQVLILKTQAMMIIPLHGIEMANHSDDGLMHLQSSQVITVNLTMTY